MTDEAPYVDVSAGAVPGVCPTCGGAGVVGRPFTPAIEGALENYVRFERCPGQCRSSGRVDLASGPGARLSRMQRAAGPWDDWTSRRTPPGA